MRRRVCVECGPLVKRRRRLSRGSMPGAWPSRAGATRVSTGCVRSLRARPSWLHAPAVLTAASRPRPNPVSPIGGRDGLPLGGRVRWWRCPAWAAAGCVAGWRCAAAAACAHALCVQSADRGAVLRGARAVGAVRSRQELEQEPSMAFGRARCAPGRPPPFALCAEQLTARGANGALPTASCRYWRAAQTWCVPANSTPPTVMSLDGGGGARCRERMQQRRRRRPCASLAAGMSSTRSTQYTIRASTHYHHPVRAQYAPSARPEGRGPGARAGVLGRRALLG